MSPDYDRYLDAMLARWERQCEVPDRELDPPEDEDEECRMLWTDEEEDDL